MWGTGDAAEFMLLALERGWQLLETGSVDAHPEMSSLRKVCKHTLGLAAWGSFYQRVKRNIDANAMPGLKTVLNADCEKKLEDHLLLCADIGWGKDKDQVQTLALDLAQCEGHFDFLASDGWYDAYMDRHPVMQP
jgi:hypothetical protein